MKYKKKKNLDSMQCHTVPEVQLTLQQQACICHKQTSQPMSNAK